jgi:hydroxypyruvate reductase
VTDKPHVLIHSAWYEPAMDRLDELAQTHHLYKASDKDAFLAEFAPKCTIIGTMHYCPAKFMDAVPDLKLILNFGVGVDGVDVAEATRRGVKVVNTPAVLNDCVADMALAMTLSARRHVPQADRYARAGRWPVEGDYQYTLNVHSTKVGILGMGRIGMEIADRCRAFKMDISYHQRTQRDDVPYTYYNNLVAMAADVDILIAIIPGGDATRGLVNEAVMEALGPSGLLVNVARGTVVDNDALARCLKDGRLGGAAVDVYPDEPNIPPALLEIIDNLTLTPHMASGTHYTRNAMGMVLYDNLQAMIEGKPLLTPVN